MYEKILNMTWNDFMNSDFLFKSNTEKHVIQIDSKELSPDDDSFFLIYFNLYTGAPMVLLQRYNHKGVTIDDSKYPNYIITKTEGDDDSEDGFTEIVFVLKSVSEALTE